jgi:hypothetical protein
LDDAVPLEPTPDVKPDDDGWSCCHGGILSLLLSKRFASSNDIRFLLEINCLAKITMKSIRKISNNRYFTLFNGCFSTF